MSQFLDIQSLNRPDKRLLTSYIIHSFLWGPAFLYPLITNIVRYQTLHYQFDDDGITVSWGRLSRREVRVNYGAIQDIHLRSDIVERWLGLARLEIQTASGEAAAELRLEGIPQYAELRDFLLGRMQQNRHKSPLASAAMELPAAAKVATVDETTLVALASTLNGVADEIQALRQELARRERAAPSGEAEHE